MRNIIVFLLVITLQFCLMVNSALALINLDDESVKIAIKYGLDNKYSTSKELMGPNWIEADNGVIISIYSPFIQLATKAKSQNVPGSSEEDIKLVKRRLGRQLNQIKTRQQVRFIVQVVGPNEAFAKELDAHLLEIPGESTEIKKKEGKGFWIFKDKGPRKPKKIPATDVVKQSVADLDHFNPVLPYSATNSYNFDFEKVNKWNKFYFVLTDGEKYEVKVEIDKNAIF